MVVDDGVGGDIKVGGEGCVAEDEDVVGWGFRRAGGWLGSRRCIRPRCLRRWRSGRFRFRFRRLGFRRRIFVPVCSCHLFFGIGKD